MSKKYKDKRKQYFYDAQTKQFMFQSEAFVDPLQSKIVGEQIFILSANATFEQPLEPKEGYAIIFNGKTWQYIEDNRGKIVWKSYTQNLQITKLGAIPEGYSEQQPQKPITMQDYDAIMQQYIMSVRYARGYTSRQPTDYLNSSTPRWKQDALDFIAFRDKCLQFGQSVINNYQTTGIVPSLEQFEKNLKQTCVCIWTYNEQMTHKELVQFIYSEKCRIAYGGVKIIKNGKSYLFETSMDSATMCSCQLHALKEQNNDYIVYWKVWQNDEPQMLELTKPEFIKVFSFSRDVINTAFGVQGMLNKQAKTFTQKQLKNKQFIMNFQITVVSRFDAINNQLEI